MEELSLELKKEMQWNNKEAEKSLEFAGGFYIVLLTFTAVITFFA